MILDSLISVIFVYCIWYDIFKVTESYTDIIVVVVYKRWVINLVMKVLEYTYTTEKSQAVKKFLFIHKKLYTFNETKYVVSSSSYFALKKLAFILSYSTGLHFLTIILIRNQPHNTFMLPVPFTTKPKNAFSVTQNASIRLLQNFIQWNFLLSDCLLA